MNTGADIVLAGKRLRWKEEKEGSNKERRTLCVFLIGKKRKENEKKKKKKKKRRGAAVAGERTGSGRGHGGSVGETGRGGCTINGQN